MKDGLRLLFGFHGRIRRSEWWLSRLVIIGAVFAGFAGVMGLAATAKSFGEGGGVGAVIWGVVALIFGVLGPVGLLALVWIHLATSVKRLHDNDMTGWLVLITVIPAIGPLFSLIVLGCLDSQAWTNKHGPSPKPGSGERVAGQFA